MSSGEELGFSIELPQGDTAISYEQSDADNAVTPSTSRGHSDGYRIRCVNYIQVIVPVMQPPSSAQSHHEIQAQVPSAAPAAHLLPPSNPAPHSTQKPPRQGTARKSVAGAPKVHYNASPPQKRRRKSASVSSDADASSTDSDEQYSDSISGEAISSSEEEEDDEESQDGDNEAASNANAYASAIALARAKALGQAQTPAASPVRREADTSDGNITIAEAIKLHIDNQPYTSFFRRWLGVSFSIDEMLEAGRIIPLVHSKIGRMRSRSPLYLLIEKEGFVILQKMYKDLADGQKAMRTFRIYAFNSVKELQYNSDFHGKIMLRFILHPDSSNVQYYKTTSKAAGLGIEEEEEVVLFARCSHDNFKETAWSNCFRTLTEACNRFKIPNVDCPISHVKQIEDRQKIWQK